MKASKNRRATIVGLFIFMGIIFLLLGILTIGNLHNSFVKKIVVTTIFDDVNGLQAGNNIWFSGVKIGTVSKMHFYGKSQVKVLMKLDEKSQQYIRKDAKVKISTDGLIGNKIIVIYGGTSKAGPVQEGDTLGIEKTLSTDDMMNTFQANNKNLLDITNDFKVLSKRIVNGEGTLGKLMSDESMYHNISLAIASLRKASEDAGKLTAVLSDYSVKLQQKGTIANTLVTDTTLFNSVRVTVNHLQQVASSAAELTANLKNASSDPNTPIGVLLHDEQSAENLKSAIRNLDSSSQKLNENMEGLQHNFLLRGYFKKKDKDEQKQTPQVK